MKPDEPPWNALKAMVTHGVHGVAAMEDSEIVGAFERDDPRVLRAMKPTVVVGSSDTSSWVGR
ncbi:hypothetical protein [Methanopyrus sp.]